MRARLSAIGAKIIKSTRQASRALIGRPLLPRLLTPSKLRSEELGGIVCGHTRTASNNLSQPGAPRPRGQSAARLGRHGGAGHRNDRERDQWRNRSHGAHSNIWTKRTEYLANAVAPTLNEVFEIERKNERESKAARAQHIVKLGQRRRSAALGRFEAEQYQRRRNHTSSGRGHRIA